MAVASTHGTVGRIFTTRNLTLIALLFHAIGLVGIGILHSPAISTATPIHLLLMTALLLLAFRTQKQYFIWAAFLWTICFTAEYIGIHTHLLFGSYKYTAALGIRLLEVPLLIGGTWLIVVSGSIATAATFIRNRWLQSAAAALIATGFDYILEPAAIRLGYWNWLYGNIPLFNYISWALVAFLVSLCWQAFCLRPNQFAINLFFTQLIFFILLRCLL